MNKKTIIKAAIIFIGALLLAVILAVIFLDEEKDLGLFPEMLANDIEESISKERTWFYIFERDFSCECSVVTALTNPRIIAVMEKASWKCMEFKVIIPSSLNNLEEVRRISYENLFLEIRIVAEQDINAIPEKSDFRKNLYLSGSFICQEIRCSDDNRKYVKRWRYAPKFAMILKERFEKLWAKSVPI
jgi:hypothetical protein